jgi:hypothetical protein
LGTPALQHKNSTFDYFNRVAFLYKGIELRPHRGNEGGMGDKKGPLGKFLKNLLIKIAIKVTQNGVLP